MMYPQIDRAWTRGMRPREDDAGVAGPWQLRGPEQLAGHGGFTVDEWRVLARRLSLSDREAQVVCGVFDGLSDRRIAEELNISSHTVHSYLRQLYRRLFVNNRCGLIVRVVAESRRLR